MVSPLAVAAPVPRFIHRAAAWAPKGSCRPTGFAAGGCSGKWDTYPIRVLQSMAEEAKWRQVSRSDKKLAEVIADGTVPAPSLMGFNDWQKWRKSSGTRPGVARGDGAATTSGQEVALWKTTMEELCGDTWREDLAEMEAATAADDWDVADAPGGSGARASGAGAPAARAEVPVASALSLRSGGQDTPGGRSGVGSPGQRGELPTAAKLWESLRREFDPSEEDRATWQSRVLEVVGQLTSMGYVVPESEMEKTVRKAGYAKVIRGKTLAEQVGFLKAEFGRVLLDEEGYAEIEHTSRLEALIEMLRDRGTELSSSAQKMFTGTSVRPSPVRPGPNDGDGLGGMATPIRLEPVGGAPPRGSVPDFVALTPPRNAGGRTLEQEVAYLRDRLRLAETERQPDSMSQSVLAKAIELQTEAISQVPKSKDGRHSTIKVSPTFKWPLLGDDGPDAKEVEEFYEKYEDLRRLANDGRGMNPMEHLTTLVSCLRGSKEKIYRIVYKKHRKLGKVEKDPDAVFNEIRERHMRFIETPMERQMRVLGEWDSLWKGNRSALQFEAVFEESVTELELSGLAKNERELLLGYLQKIGPQLAAEVQKDVRTCTSREGQTVSRRVSSWEEAHRVHVEIEGIKAAGRALIPTYALQANAGGKGTSKGSGKQASGSSENTGGPRAVCHEMRDKGACKFGDS